MTPNSHPAQRDEVTHSQVHAYNTYSLLFLTSRLHTQAQSPTGFCCRQVTRNEIMSQLRATSVSRNGRKFSPLN